MSTFNNLWAMYPRKVNKRMAEKAFSKLNLMEQEQAIEAMPNHIAYWKSQDTQLAFIPHLASWLNAYRFEDEIVIEPPKVNKRPELPWYSSEELTIKKATEVGCPAYAGEGWQQWRARISNKIKQLEEQA
jgi:hypothetical protein